MSGVSSAERRSVRSATSMTSEQWSLDWGLCGSPPPLFPTKTTYASIHIHSCLLPVIFACLSFQLLPSLIVTQLGMSDQASWERTKASLLAARLEAVWTQTPERHTEQKNSNNNRSKNQNGAKEGSWAEKGNKGHHISALTILLLSVVPRNYHITYVIQQNRTRNTTIQYHRASVSFLLTFMKMQQW